MKKLNLNVLRDLNKNLILEFLSKEIQEYISLGYLPREILVYSWKAGESSTYLKIQVGETTTCTMRSSQSFELSLTPQSFLSKEENMKIKRLQKIWSKIGEEKILLA